MVSFYYSSFRHWGHPFLDYFEGLTILHKQVTADSKINQDYADLLASDLAYKVLSHEFHKQKRWHIDLNLLDPANPLYSHVRNNTWPTNKQILDFGPNWHKLPLTPCYELPIGIDPSVLFADKSHSMNRREVLDFIVLNPGKPIPSQKVLKTAIQTQNLNLNEFLSNINEHGLPLDDLIIGLKGKEREVKRCGRFFSLMSWNLRLYFVITEYLIKKFYVPLFNGLTMADDYTSVIKKLLDRTKGQGENSYQYITFANHFDYSKWNNTQRGQANNPVFKVMGQFVGMPNLFVRTHEFFEQSIIYYNDRADLMVVNNNILENSTNHIVCWNGQKGGLEGLRQKGWSVVNLLVIERESKIRNTLVKVLAQGDNQVICTYYKLPNDLKQQAYQEEIPHIHLNNKEIVNSIIRGTQSLGLIVNSDETLTSADYLNYGKVILFRGQFIPLNLKRWSRVTCTTNDQIPSIVNIMSTVATNALTATQHSKSIFPGIINYCFFSMFCLWFLHLHDPLLESDVEELDVYTLSQDTIFEIFTNILFKDPSIGGSSGVSLTRFLIRQFPDPVTESLSFWKIVHENTSNEHLKMICVKNGYPDLIQKDNVNLNKLLENPMSLNIPKGLDATTLLRDAVRQQLFQYTDQIENQLFRESVTYLKEEETALNDFLDTIKPLFPRFLSEFKASTFIGITESIVGLFQNSRTIRQIFRKKFSTEVGLLLRESEKRSIKRFTTINRYNVTQMWDCSSEQADFLRTLSWGSEVIGTTIPHPIEMLGRVTKETVNCPECALGPYKSCYISVIYPYGFSTEIGQRGPLPPYLGSRTSESTSLFQPWEKEVEAPLLNKSMKLRNAIQWFVPKSSFLSKSITNNLKSLTGLDWNEIEISFERTGSAIHRFHCSRQSPGGYASVNPNLLSYVFVTSDTLGELNLINHDFMYQSLLLYSQISSIETNILSTETYFHHFHIDCSKCIREIDNITIDSTLVYEPHDVSDIVSRMSGFQPSWIQRIPQIEIKEGNWENLSCKEQSFHIGISQGTVFSLYILNNEPGVWDQSLFPETVTKYIVKKYYLLGLLQGLIMGGSFISTYHRELYDRSRPIRAAIGSTEYLISRLINSPHFIPSLHNWNFHTFATYIPHRLPPSYPSNKRDLGSFLVSYFHFHISKRTLLSKPYRSWSKNLWIFSDFRTGKWIGLMLACHYLRDIYYQGNLSSSRISRINEVKDIITFFLQYNKTQTISTIKADHIYPKMQKLARRALGCSSEVRHAVKKMIGEDLKYDLLEEYEEDIEQKAEYVWGPEYIGSIKSILVKFEHDKPNYDIPPVPYILDPLISGLRLGQLSTGAHYKIRAIIARIKGVKDILCGGDGSGGMSAAALRFFQNSKLIFNSLMNPTDNSFMGVKPSPPAALAGMCSGIKTRCVNLNSCWNEPSDLTLKKTWINFINLKHKFDLSINLGIFDMETKNIDPFCLIMENLLTYSQTLFNSQCYIIIKVYGSLFKYPKYLNIINRLGSMFQEIIATYTNISSSFTSEFYLVCKNQLSCPLHPNYITQSSICMILTSCYANQTLPSEFKRALSLKKHNLLMGIPYNLVPSITDELFSILLQIGLESGVSKLVTAHIEDEVDSENILSFIMIILIMGSNSIISTTESSVYVKNVPSFEHLQIHYSLFIGCWVSLAWILENYMIYQTVHWWIEHKVYYGFEFTKTKYGHQIKWNWNKGKIGKNLHKPSKLHLSSELIRLFSRLSKNQKSPGTSFNFIYTAVDEILDKYNKGLTFTHLVKNTGLFSFLPIQESTLEEAEIQTSQETIPIIQTSDLLQHLTNIQEVETQSWSS